MEISFALLGTVQATVDGADLTLDVAMLRAVLAALLLAGGQRLTSNRLSQALWAAPPRSAASNLRTYLARVRAALRAVSPGLAGRLVTVPDGGGYLLTLAPGELDARVFGDLARRGQAHLLAGEHAVAAALLHDALALWRGPAGQDIAVTGTLRQQLTDLDEQRVIATEDYVEARLALGATSGLLPEIRALVLEHPLRDRPWEQLMRALYRAGDPAGALDAYQSARRRFSDALGIEPSRRLQHLQGAILRRDDVLIARPALP
ncbi:AfsR/SARP family transcriptional regulator [Micromonospora auratinigra]|uniref:DNA-binding transcriptional activator of the SARP family n=1 Tax=Micromonospora auratinigra TaxID=261654 RepID=A0A1A9AAH7_9ACTN|nr:AfsR/SARP family transcriptional regulator [Micromonospora auratinigra]SBT53103.1 DNA-binding transcriptional activator of the SARP family [Micromonospora auratinigra]